MVNNNEIMLSLEELKNMLDNITDETAIKITILTPNGGEELNYWWNNNELIRSALIIEQRELKLEMLNI